MALRASLCVCGTIGAGRRRRVQVSPVTTSHRGRGRAGRGASRRLISGYGSGGSCRLGGSWLAGLTGARLVSVWSRAGRGGDGADGQRGHDQDGVAGDGGYTAITRHAVLVMAALAICAITTAPPRDRTDTQAPPPVRPGQPPPAEPGMIPLTIPEIKRLLAALTTRPAPTPVACHPLGRLATGRHQARSRWFHKRARLAPATPRSPC